MLDSSFIGPRASSPFCPADAAFASIFGDVFQHSQAFGKTGQEANREFVITICLGAFIIMP